MVGVTFRTTAVGSRIPSTDHHRLRRNAGQACAAPHAAARKRAGASAGQRCTRKVAPAGPTKTGGLVEREVEVGACVDDRLVAVRDAAREAMVNAAKYAKGAPVSMYVEVEPEQVTVFVRDRGPGFEADTVPADRLGLRQSVVGRMARHGGRATVTSAPGEGTEVQLEMPRDRSPS